MKKITLFLLFLISFAQNVVPAADFNGDGTNDVAIFRPTTGLWAIRQLTRFYYGMAGDNPAPGDYNGDGSADIVIFRPTTGLWAVRNISRLYFGTVGDISLSTAGATYNPNLLDVDPVSGYVRIGWGSQTSGLQVGRESTSQYQKTRAHKVTFFGKSDASGDSRFIWDAENMALRIGQQPTGSDWDDPPGICSISSGYNSTATGWAASVFGKSCGASGKYSFATGHIASAQGICSFAKGLSSFATGDYATAIGGQFLSANDNYSIAIGSWVAAGAEYSIVIGKGYTEYPNPKVLGNSIPDSLMVGFNTSTDPTFFVDSTSVGIGTTSPARKLHVNDVMRLEPRVSSPDNPGEGDLYFDSSTHKLRCYDGSSWQDCF